MDVNEYNKNLDIHNLEILENKKIVIYGAGKYGGILYSFLSYKGFHKNVICFTVSKKNGNPDILYGKEVKDINEIREELYDCTVLVAIGKSGADEVIRHLGNYKVKDWYCVTGKIMEEVTEKLIQEDSKLPLEGNKVFFLCYEGMGYRCNCKYIAEQMIKGSYPVKLVWAVSDNSIQDVPEPIKTVLINTTEYYKELMTSGIYITNTMHKLFEYKRKGQFYINTWHGYGPFKLAEGDVYDDEVIKNIFKMRNAACDLFITASTFYSKIYRSAFYYEGEIYECGAPRNDVFFMKNNIREYIYHLFKIPRDKRILLYAPTFRTDIEISFNKYDIDMERILEALAQRFHSEYVLMYRFHHYLYATEKSRSFYPDGIDVTFYSDIQELLAAADVVITDYSSLMWDFSLQKKPVFLYQNDINEYQNDRGFYAPVSEWPYPRATTQDELVDKIVNFNNEEYIQQLNNFLEKYGSCDDGHAAEHVIARIMSEIEKNTVK